MLTPRFAETDPQRDHPWLEALPDSAVIMDETGIILAVNAPWRVFAQANAGAPDAYSGENYLEVCRNAPVAEVGDLPRRLGAVLEGASDFLEWEYPCHSPSERRWFRLTATRFLDNGRSYVVVIHRCITNERLNEETAKAREQQFESVLAHTREGFVVVQGTGVIRYANPRAGELLGESAEHLIGRDLGFPIPSSTGQTLNLPLSAEDSRSVAMYAVQAEWEGGPAWILHLHDITDQVAAERALRSRAHQQVLIARVGRLALSTVELDQVFTEAASAISNGLRVQYSKVVLLDSTYTTFVLKAGVGWQSDWVGRRIHNRSAGSQLDYVITSEDPLIVDDLRDEVRFTPSELLTAHHVVSGIDVRIGSVRRPLGVLGAYGREIRQFSTDDVGFLQSLANTLSAAIERQNVDDQLNYLAQHDALTGLPNRSLFTDRLQVALAHAEHSGNPLALLFLDLDRFKNVNDVFGHGLGDEVLREVATRFAHCMRATDMVSRQGGDEFLVILPELDEAQDAARVAETLLEAVISPLTIGGTEVVVGASIGIACFPDNGRDATALLSNADAAMYAAKEQGRHRYQFYSNEMNARAHEHMALESDLRYAIERDELFPVYQPQIDLATGTIVGVEALLRWRHPTRGLVSPGQFIPIAEDSGLIVPIGTWVLESACRQHAEWVAQGWITGTMAVNVSPRQFQQPDFVERVVEALSRSGLQAWRLELEVTEGLFMHNLEEVRHKLARLGKLGVKLAMDDFGTGYSSLSYLKQLPLYRLKIDQSFTRGLPDDRESGAIAQAIIHMGHSLGLNVLAEGIETQEQMDYLQSLACNAGQGYLIARPLPANECMDFLRTRS